MESQGGAHSPGLVGELEVSNEHDGLRGGTRKLCHHPDGPHMRQAIADWHTGTVQSPSAAPVDGSHTRETSEVVKKSEK